MDGGDGAGSFTCHQEIWKIVPGALRQPLKRHLQDQCVRLGLWIWPRPRDVFFPSLVGLSCFASLFCDI